MIPLNRLPRTPDGGYRADGVEAAYAEFARAAAEMSAELKVARAAARRAWAQPSPNRSQIEAGITAERIVRAATEFADELQRDAERHGAQTIAAARAQARVIIERARDVTRELLRAASLGDTYLDEMTAALLQAASTSASTK
jgi:cell division septum initiation protein DivIVA